MSNLTDLQMAEAIEGYNKQAALDEAIEAVLTKHLGIEAAKAKEDFGYAAWATSALAVGVIIANVLLAAKRPNSGRGVRAISDLAYVLNTNDFWTRNSGFLMPLVIVSINAQVDHTLLASEPRNPQQHNIVDRVLRGTELIGLEIFTAILYLVGGPEAMAKSAVQLRMDLAPLFLR